MNVLAIGSHPDDVEIGCGGTLNKLARLGHECYLLIMTSGEVGGDPSARKTEQEAAAAVLGARRVFWGGFRDTEITARRETIRIIEEVVVQTRPDLILVHAGEDTHQDHRAVNACALSASRHIKSLLFYECPTTIDFVPNIFVDIGVQIIKKFEALKAHASQVDRTNITGLSIVDIAGAQAHFRGMQSRVRFAEGFRSPRLLLDMDWKKEE